MVDTDNLRKIEEKINRKKIKLNELTRSGLNKHKIIIFSQELDLLINEYYNLQLKN